MSSMTGAERLTISIGLTEAMPATRMRPPQRGELRRPKEPEITASHPRSAIWRPKLGAFGVTASLKAKAAASPEPVSTPIK